MKQVYLLSTLFLIAAFSPCRADTTTYHMTEALSVLPIKKVDKLIFVEAEVDGRKGYFLFDTGVGGLTLNEMYFGEDEDTGVLTKITDINGRKERVRGTYVEDFRWGGIARSGFLAPLLDLSGLEAILDLEIFGLMGQKVYSDIEVHIDFDKQAMTLMRLDQWDTPEEQPFRAKPEHVLPFSLEYYIPVIKARIGQLELNLGWDSGASINTMDKRLRRDLPEDARKLMRISYGGVLSERSAPFIAVNAIHLDEQFSVQAWRMAATRMKHFSKQDIHIDGLIGADLFRLGAVSINYRKRRISVWVNDNVFSNRYAIMGPEDGLSAPDAVVASPE